MKTLCQLIIGLLCILSRRDDPDSGEREKGGEGVTGVDETEEWLGSAEKRGGKMGRRGRVRGMVKQLQEVADKENGAESGSSVI